MVILMLFQAFLAIANFIKGTYLNKVSIKIRLALNHQVGAIHTRVEKKGFRDGARCRKQFIELLIGAVV